VTEIYKVHENTYSKNRKFRLEW